jgi:hypothetical protein
MANRRRPRPRKDREGKDGNPRPGQSLFTDWIPCKTEPDGRIRLPKRIVKVLKEHHIEELWVGFRPKQQVLIFCPPCFWDDWQKRMRNETDEETWKEIECLEMTRLQKVGWEEHGRVTPNLWAKKFFGIEGACKVIFHGRGKWFELFSEARVRRFFGGK